MKKDYEEIVDDVENLYYTDKTIQDLYTKLHNEHRAKGLIYKELAKSKMFNSIKYLLTSYPDGKFSILDLDTNEEYWSTT